MSTSDEQLPPTQAPQDDMQGQDYREALAQWRLTVRTQCKRVSSLPTAMFDATDPMLEMRLAEATETMLQELRTPDVEQVDPATRELRLEPIDATELRRLPARFENRDAGRVDLLSHLADEYLGILADTCHTADPAIKQRAAEQLSRDFGVTPALVPETLEELRQSTAAANADADCERAADELEEALTRVEDALRAFFDATDADRSEVDAPAVGDGEDRQR